MLLVATFARSQGFGTAAAVPPQFPQGECMHRIITVVLLFVMVAFIAAPSVMAEDQPHMQAALESLRQAKEHLQQADHDKGGHRDKAIKNVDDAIKHVEEGMKYDNSHESKHEEMKEHKH
jgi:mannitol-specific phosphotransferase system IIBC component